MSLTTDVTSKPPTTVPPGTWPVHAGDGAGDGEEVGGPGSRAYDTGEDMENDLNRADGAKKYWEAQLANWAWRNGVNVEEDEGTTRAQRIAQRRHAARVEAAKQNKAEKEAKAAAKAEAKAARAAAREAGEDVPDSESDDSDSSSEGDEHVGG